MPAARIGEGKGKLVIEYGPLRVLARASHHEMPQPPTLVLTLPTDGWMRGYAVDLVDARGRVLPLPLGLTLTPWRARFLHPQGWVCRA